MSSTLSDVLTIAVALGSGLIAGFFLAFSVCVMRALAKIPPAQGIAVSFTLALRAGH